MYKRHGVEKWSLDLGSEKVKWHQVTTINVVPSSIGACEDFILRPPVGGMI